MLLLMFPVTSETLVMFPACYPPSELMKSRCFDLENHKEIMNSDSDQSLEMELAGRNQGDPGIIGTEIHSPIYLS